MIYLWTTHPLVIYEFTKMNERYVVMILLLIYFVVLSYDCRFVETTLFLSLKHIFKYLINAIVLDEVILISCS